MYLEGELLNDERELENQEIVMIECPSCKGSGGWDASCDCERSDEWKDCELCGGCGELAEEDIPND